MMKKSKAFTLIELLVVVSIIALLVSILLPALGKARNQAKRVLCATHLNQIGMGISVYMTEESNGRYPQQRMPIGGWGVGERTGFWWQQVTPYINKEFDKPGKEAAEGTVGNCPNHTAKDPTTSTNNQYSYVGNSKLMTNHLSGQSAIGEGTVRQAADKVLVYECHTETQIPIASTYQAGWLKYPFYYREGIGPEQQTHGDKSNFLFCDNHVDSIHGDELKNYERHWLPNP